MPPQHPAPPPAGRANRSKSSCRPKGPTLGRWSRVRHYADGISGRTEKKFMRAIIRPLLAIVVVVGIAWLGLRWYALTQLQAGFINWANGLAANGDVQVSYDSIERGGSPLAATVTVNDLRLLVQTSPAAPPLAITLPAFAMEIDAAAPLLLHFNLPNHINLNTSRGDFALTFGSISQTEHLDLS